MAGRVTITCVMISCVLTSLVQNKVVIDCKRSLYRAVLVDLILNLLFI